MGKGRLPVSKTALVTTAILGVNNPMKKLYLRKFIGVQYIASFKDKFIELPKRTVVTGSVLLLKLLENSLNAILFFKGA